MEHTTSHLGVVGRAKEGPIGTDRMVGYAIAPFSSAEARDINRSHTSLYTVDEEDDFCPAMEAGEGESSGDETNSEQRVSLVHRKSRREFKTGEGLKSEPMNASPPVWLPEGPKIDQTVCSADTSTPNKENIKLNNVDVSNVIISCNTTIALAQLSWARNNISADPTRSTDPRLRAPEFQELRENRAIEAFERLRLHSEARALPRPTVASDYSDQTSPNWCQVVLPLPPLPPTPPRPSQKRLEEEDSQRNDAESYEGMNDVGDKGADGATASEKGQEEEAMANEDGSVNGSTEECEAVVDDHTPGEDSPGSNRVYTREELVILTRKIFGDEGEEDVAFWDDDDVASHAVVGHPGEQKRSHTGAIDQQDEENDIGEGSGSGEVDEASNSDGLFGSTSNACTSTLSEGSHPHAHQDEDEDEGAKVVQDVSETVAGSVTVDTSDDVNSSENSTPPTATVSMPPTPPKYPFTALDPSSPAQPPSPLPKGSPGTCASKDKAPVGHPRSGESLNVDSGVGGNAPDMMPVPAAPVTVPEELEPSKPASVEANGDRPQPSGMRHMIHKKGLPKFSPTWRGIFASPTSDASNDASTGKRKRSREDDGDEDATSSNHPSDQQDERDVLLPRAFKKPKFEENSLERNVAILALKQPPEPSPVKRQTGPSSPLPQFQVLKSNLFEEVGAPSRVPPICGDLPSSNPQLTKPKAGDDQKSSNRDSSPQVTAIPSSLAVATTTASTSATDSKPSTPKYSPKVSTEEPSSLPAAPTNRKRKNRENEEDGPITSDVLSRPIKKPRRLADIPPPATKKPRHAVIEAYYNLMPLKRADRASCTHASETIEEVTEMVKQDLDVADPFSTDKETSFPRVDYTPYVTHVDCRDKRRARRADSSSSSDDK